MHITSQNLDETIQTNRKIKKKLETEFNLWKGI